MHIIQKQIVELEIPDEPEAFKWHSRVSSYVHEKLTPALSQLFDRTVAPHQFMRLDRLAITIRWRPEQPFGPQFTDEVLKALQTELNQYDKPDLNYLRLSKPERFFKAFIYFLQQGYLPWWAVFNGPNELEQETQVALKVISPAELKFALQTALNNRAAINRLVYQFSPQLVEAILSVLASPATFSQLLQVEKAWFEAGNLAQIKADSLQAAARLGRVYFIWLIIPPKSAPADVANALLGAMQQNNPHFLTPGFLLEFIRHYQKINPGWSLAASGRAAFYPPASAVNAIDRQLYDPSNQPEKITETITLNPQIPPAEELPGVYVPNAGLVLLAPFLPAYLAACGAAEGEKLINPAEAVHVLQYLVTGRTQTPEFELALNKILCGLALTQAVPLEIEPTSVLQTEAEQLLIAVIRYWSALKNTSPAGLQESFLQRSGKLTQKPDGDWLLQVEQKSYDMLLDQIPWVYSMVKLPWMPTLLWVEYS